MLFTWKPRLSMLPISHSQVTGKTSYLDHWFLKALSTILQKPRDSARQRSNPICQDHLVPLHGAETSLSSRCNAPHLGTHYFYTEIERQSSNFGKRCSSNDSKSRNCLEISRYIGRLNSCSEDRRNPSQRSELEHELHALAHKLQFYIFKYVLRPQKLQEVANFYCPTPSPSTINLPKPNAGAPKKKRKDASHASLSQLQRNLRPLPTTKSKSIPLNPILRVTILQRPKSLQKSHNSITSLSKRILLPNTNSRSSIEGQESPMRSQRSARRIRRPALGSKFESVRPIDVGAAVHTVDRVHKDCVFGDEDGHLSGGAAAARENGVAEGDTGVCWDRWEESESCKLSSDQFGEENGSDDLHSFRTHFR
jgi:hypothetical protein